MAFVHLIKQRAGSNFSWLFAGNLVYSMSQWAMIVILAKLGNPAMVGQYVLALSITAPVIMFANFQLRDFQATDARSQFEFRHYLSFRLLSVLAAFLLIVAIGLLAGLDRELLLVMLFVAAAKIFESVSDIYFGLMQKHEKMAYIAKSMMMKGISSVVILGAAVYMTQSIVVGSLALAAAWLLVLVLYDRPNGARVERAGRGSEPSGAARPGASFARAGSLLLLVYPLGIAATLDTLNSSIPRYFLQHAGGEEAVGYFSAIAYIMMAGGTFVNAVTQSVSPAMSRYFHYDLRRFKLLLLRIIGVCLLLGLAGIAVAAIGGAPLLRLLYDESYAGYSHIFVIIMIASTLWYVAGCLSAALTSSRRIKMQIPVFALSCAATVASSAVLIPGSLLTGAAWSVCVGMATRTGCSALLVVYAIVRQAAALAKEREQAPVPGKATRSV